MNTRMMVRRPGMSWDPLSSLRDFETMVSRWLGDDEGTWTGGTLVAQADMSETSNAVELKVDLPGMRPDDIEIQMQNNVLTISGHRQEERREEDKERSYLRIERRSGQFSRSFMMPCAVNEDEIAAEYHDGVLHITLPKSEQAKSRKIQVKSSSVISEDKGKGKK